MKFKLIEKIENLDEMARIGYLTSKLEIYIHTDDSGKIPHFHIRDVATMGNKFHTCIQILKPEYFHHDGKEDNLNAKQKKELIQFLNEPPIKLKRYNTNWELIVDSWNLNNSDVIIPDDVKIPDYRQL